MKVQCPKCKSDIIQITSRVQYFVRSATYFAVILLCCLLYNSLKDEYPDVVVFIFTLVCLGFSCLSVVLGVNYLLRGIRTKETSYECEYCSRKFKSPFDQDLV